MIIVDSGALIAAGHPGDANHARAVGVLRAATDSGERLLAPEPMLGELFGWFRRRDLSDRARRLWGLILRGAFEPTAMGADGVALAFDIDRRYADADLGFVDACLLATCERERCARLFTFDARLAAYKPTFARSLQILP